jgi:hypothetical protein
VERCRPGQPLPQVEEVFNALRRYIETKPPDVSSRTLLLLDRCQVRAPCLHPSPVHLSCPSAPRRVELSEPNRRNTIGLTLSPSPCPQADESPETVSPCLPQSAPRTPAVLLLSKAYAVIHAVHTIKRCSVRRSLLTHASVTHASRWTLPAHPTSSHSRPSHRLRPSR